MAAAEPRPRPAPPPRPPRRPTPPAAFLPASFHNRPLLARPGGLGTSPGPRPAWKTSRRPPPGPLRALLLHPFSPRAEEEAGSFPTSKEVHDQVNTGAAARTLVRHWGSGCRSGPAAGVCGPSKLWAMSLQWIIRKWPSGKKKKKDKGGKTIKEYPYPLTKVENSHSD